MNLEHLRKDIELDADLPGAHLQLNSTWGLFSPRAIDQGSRLLLAYLDVQQDDITLDMGCGYGPLGLAIAQQSVAGHVHLIDKDFVAVDYARANAQRNQLDNTTIYLSNGFSAVPKDLSLSLVVSNLPAKVGNELFFITFYDAYQRFATGWAHRSGYHQWFKKFYKTRIYRSIWQLLQTETECRLHGVYGNSLAIGANRLITALAGRGVAGNCAMALFA